MKLGFTYAGTVESNLDPLKLGRLKVRVPHVYGTDASGVGYIGTNDLPWALPAGLPAGGSAQSGGFSQLPEKGDKVWVRFLDGEPEKPIWEWGMQSAGDASKLKLHHYGSGTPVGKPDRAIWTRYNHAAVMDAGSFIVTTSQGYRLVLTDASEAGANDGNILVTTPKGNSIKLDDLDDTLKVVVLEDLYFNVSGATQGLSDSFSWTTMSGSFDVSSANGINMTSAADIELTTSTSFILDCLEDISLTGLGPTTMGFSTLKLGLTATEPAVLGAVLRQWIQSLLLWLATHTHTSSSPGSPTSPAQQPTSLILPDSSELLSETVKVQD